MAGGYVVGGMNAPAEWLALPERTRRGLMFLKALELLESAPDPLYALASARAALDILPERDEWAALVGSEDGYEPLVESLRTIAGQIPMKGELAKVLPFERPVGGAA